MRDPISGMIDVGFTQEWSIDRTFLHRNSEKVNKFSKPVIFVFCLTPLILLSFPGTCSPFDFIFNSIRRIKASIFHVGIQTQDSYATFV